MKDNNKHIALLKGLEEQHRLSGLNYTRKKIGTSLDILPLGITILIINLIIILG
ncbi:MAG: hypothetical protein N2249_04870 [Melioribacter sp.]|nr:hypothetical protein [Melioribacter sp.]